MYLLLLVAASILLPSSADQHESKLYQDLLSGYNRLERPVSNNTEPVLVTLGNVLQQLLDVHEHEQRITALIWQKFTWTDYKLKWEPSQYGGVGSVYLPVDRIWIPDVLLYNSVQPSTQIFSTDADGTINWIPPYELTFSCKFDLYHFPYDKQTCYLKYGSWTKDGFLLHLDFDNPKLDLSEYLENSEWEITDVDGKRSVKFYECCPEPYPDLKFFLTIQRRSIYYTLIIVVPVIVFTILALFGLLLPPKAEKVFFEMVLLFSFSYVAYTVTLACFSVTLLGIYCTVMVLLLSITVVFSIFVASLYGRPQKMGKLSRTIFLKILPRLLCMSQPSDQQVYTEMPLLKNEFTASGEQDKLDIALMNVLQNVRTDIQEIYKLLEKQSETEDNTNDWRFAASVVDRFCAVLMILFLFFCIARFARHLVSDIESYFSLH